MAISRMQEPRQLYGLGSLVKSIGKTIKKVVKSPIGKAAILGLGAYGLGGGLGGKFSLGTLGSRLGLGTLTGGEENVFAGGPFSGIANFARDKFSNMGTGTKLGIGTALATYLAQGGMEEEEIAEIQNDPDKLKMYLKDYYSKTNPDASGTEIEEFVRINSAVGGRVGLMGGAMPTGIMRANKAGTIERDYRETGGFVPVGIKEKADDVPAMLSKNEFVMTADAVRGMGDGNIEKGAQRLYDQMKTAEKRVV